MTANPEIPSSPAGNELLITRVFDAPRELVWRAWTEPDHLAQWFFCKDFQMLFVDIDLRPGGAWRSGMRSPDGREYISHGVYEQIDKPRRLVFTHTWEQNDIEPPGVITRAIVTFEERDGKTEMTLRQTGFVTPESRNSHHGGWSEGLERFTRYVHSLVSRTDQNINP